MKYILKILICLGIFYELVQMHDLTKCEGMKEYLNEKMKEAEYLDETCKK